MLIEYIPLQQGLRQSFLEEALKNPYLIEYIPLQQGLRQFEIGFYKLYFKSH